MCTRKRKKVRLVGDTENAVMIGNRMLYPPTYKFVSVIVTRFKHLKASGAWSLGTVLPISAGTWAAIHPL